MPVAHIEVRLHGLRTSSTSHRYEGCCEQNTHRTELPSHNAAFHSDNRLPLTTHERNWTDSVREFRSRKCTPKTQESGVRDEHKIHHCRELASPSIHQYRHVGLSPHIIQFKDEYLIKLNARSGGIEQQLLYYPVCTSVISFIRL